MDAVELKIVSNCCNPLGIMPCVLFDSKDWMRDLIRHCRLAPQELLEVLFHSRDHQVYLGHGYLQSRRDLTRSKMVFEVKQHCIPLLARVPLDATPQLPPPAQQRVKEGGSFWDCE